MKDIRERIVLPAAIAAVYAAVSIVLGSFGFGAVQVRVSEALTLLPVISPVATAGVTLGCFLANLIGLAMGTNILGFPDVIIGTAATFAAALLTRATGKIRLFGLPAVSALMPVVINAFVIGGEISYAVSGKIAPESFWPAAATVGAGEALSCIVLGLTLIYILEKRGLDKSIFGK